MKPYFFLSTLYFLMNSQGAFAETVIEKPKPAYYYPAIEVSSKFSEAIFLDGTHKVLNCPMLFNNSWDYPNGSSIALCDDAQLACLRYGLLLEKIKTATGKLLAELKQTLVLEKEEVKIRLRGCQLVLEMTGIEGKTLQDAAGYPMDPLSITQ